MNSTLMLALTAIAIAQAHQPFDSKSTGADGALVLTAPGTVIFDPRSFNPPFNAAGDNIYHFTSIYVGKGVRLKLSAKLFQGPVFWLAQGPVDIEGTIDLDGADGDRMPALAGAGGYPGGGIGQSGYGPASFKKNAFLVPLVGGSGGAGGPTTGGGAGGGALLIASSASITVNGAIRANGGASSDGVGGEGGSIRLVAPVIDGSGFAIAKGGGRGAGDGQVRLEALTNRFSGSLNGTPLAIGKPFGLFLPPNPPPSVRVLSIGGEPVNGPEFTLRKQQESLTVTIEAHFIPVGTRIELECFPESGPSQTITTTPLAGTFELSTAKASATFPTGLSGCQATANWDLTRQEVKSKP